MPGNDLYVVLVHFPVRNRNGRIIGSALTNMDLHDIARASMTFGVKGFYVVTPYEDQIRLAGQIMDHWIKGVGGVLNPFRKQALELVRVSPDVEDAVHHMRAEIKKPVVTVATSARPGPDAISTGILRQRLAAGTPHALVFGTAWGLADELMKTCDNVLEPIYGTTDYNHLSVRSAVSIYLDRIINGGAHLNQPEETYQED